MRGPPHPDDKVSLFIPCLRDLALLMATHPQAPRIPCSPKARRDSSLSYCRCEIRAPRARLTKKVRVYDVHRVYDALRLPYIAARPSFTDVLYSILATGAGSDRDSQVSEGELTTYC